MNASEAEALLDKYYEGETSLAEEQQLRAYFRDPGGVPVHLRSHAAQFGAPEALRTQQTKMAAWEDWLVTYDRSQVREKGNQRWLGFPAGWRVAASITLILLGFGGGVWYNHSRGPVGSPPLAQSEPAQVAAARRVLGFNQAGSTSASERIQVVRQMTNLPEADEELIQILVNTLNFDDNVNVRLAACGALYHFGQTPRVREAFIQSLRVQTDPNVQVALIDALIALEEKRALREMQRLTQDSTVLEVVRLRARQGVGKLI
jgi:hypothetical protein